MFLYLPPILSLWRGKVLALGNLSSSEQQFLSSRNVFLVLGQESNGLWVPRTVGGRESLPSVLGPGGSQEGIWFASLSG